MKNFYRLFLEIIAVVIFSSAVSAATFTVNSLADGDDGICDVVSCTLREAINAANAAGGADTINFSVSGTINVGATLGGTAGTPLPAITGQTTVDGGGTPNPTCTGTATIVVVLNGAGAGAGSSGLTLAAGSTTSTIRGLNIQGFNGNGIEINSGSNLIQGNFIGTNQTGTAAATNNTNGIAVTGGTLNTIGGATVGLRNIISGNGGRGISVSGLGGSNTNTIQGNYIGTDAAGAADVGNAFDGIEIFQSFGNTIGGAAATALGCAPGNVISGNDGGGVHIAGGDNNSVRGNFIGTASDGTADVGNTEAGIYLHEPEAVGNQIGGTTGDGNRIRFNGNGILIPTLAGGEQATRSCNTTTFPGEIRCTVSGFQTNRTGNPGIGEIAPGSNQVLLAITFNVAANAPNGTTPVTFSTDPNNNNVSTDAPVTTNIPTVNGVVMIMATTAANATLGGRVTAANGSGIRNVRVTLTDTAGKSRTILTGSFGYYSFEEVPSGETYVVSVASSVFNSINLRRLSMSRITSRT